MIAAIAALPWRHGLLHRLRAKAHQRHRVAKCNRPAATSAVYSPRL
jgi:hypothetical protein